MKLQYAINRSTRGCFLIAAALVFVGAGLVPAHRPLPTDHWSLTTGH